MTNKETAFPFKVRSGSVSVTIYHTAGMDYEAFTVSASVNGKRVRFTRSTFEEARKVAKDLADNIAAGKIAVMKLGAADADMLARVKGIIEPTGKNLETVAREFLQACEILRLANCDSPVEAARFYLEKNPISLKPITVENLVSDFIESRKLDGRSEAYLCDLDKRLSRFTAHFSGNLREITGNDVETWLRSLGVGPRSRNNFRTTVNTLFEFAKARRYLPRDWHEMESVSIAAARIGKIKIFTPKEMAALLNAAPESCIPFLAIGAFAGIRHAEIDRLHWSHVRGEFIEVNAESAKTQERRLVPILPNLAAWLAPFRTRTGPVCPLVDMMKPIIITAKKCGVDWQKNGLRHSFISYRLAQIQNAPQVALEAGNSVRKIFSNYREIVTPSDSAKWFSIAPNLNK